MVRRRRNKIDGLFKEEDGTWCEDALDLKSIDVDHFRNLFTAHDECDSCFIIPWLFLNSNSPILLIWDAVLILIKLTLAYSILEASKLLVLMDFLQSSFPSTRISLARMYLNWFPLLLDWEKFLRVLTILSLPWFLSVITLSTCICFDRLAYVPLFIKSSPRLLWLDLGLSFVS